MLGSDASYSSILQFCLSFVYACFCPSDIKKEFLNDRWTFVKLYPQKKRFLSPRRGLNEQPSDDRWNALTTELPRLDGELRCKFNIRATWTTYWLPLRSHIRRCRTWNQLLHMVYICNAKIRSSFRDHFSLVYYSYITFNWLTISNSSKKYDFNINNVFH